MAGRTRDILAAVGRPTAVLTSANATWVDATELAGVRAAVRGATVSTLYGYVPEGFSVTPLAAVAATLVSGKLPRLLGAGLPADVRAADGTEPVESFGVLATDYTGLVSAVRVARADACTRTGVA
jgi:hypothetical protein